MYNISNTPRWHLLTTVSAMALLASVGGAMADDDAKPVLWIELGGQLESLKDAQEPFAPPFLPALLQNPFTPPSKDQTPPRYMIGDEARLSFSPQGSDWIFSAGIHYGRAGSSGYSHEETTPPQYVGGLVSVPALGLHLSITNIPVAAKRFATTSAHNSDTELLLDFQAGKDVGLGLFGSQASSTLSAGVRFAQFTSRSTARIDSDPDFHISYKYQSTFFGFPADIKLPKQSWNLFQAKLSATRSFNGAGPSLEWDTSTPLAGNPDSGIIALDWGVNGAILFGRQKVHAQHTEIAHHGTDHAGYPGLPTLYPTAVHNIRRTKSVVVPNIGGFAGLSYQYANAKLSLGYRADFFFNAIDGGIDARKSENRGFFGPYASISVGLGD